MFLYRDKHRFQKALFREVGARLTVWQRVTLAKLLVLRAGTTATPLLVACYAIMAGLLLGVSLVAAIFS